MVDDRPKLIVEADGGSRGNPGPAAYGALVRGADGTVLMEVADHVGIATNNVAEYRGLIAGLQAAAALDDTATIEARLDSKLVVEQLSGRWKIKNAALAELARTATALAGGRVRYTWVPRAQNTAADALANESMDAVAAGRSGRITRQYGVAGELSGQDAEQVSGSRTRNTVVGWAPDLGKPTRLLLARHGATAYSLERKFSGAGGTDPELATIGLAQAHALATELLARGRVDVVVASPLLRTRQTAQIVADRLGLPVEIDEGFVECAFGDWDGHTYAEVLRRWPVELEAWLAAPDVAPPGGESFTHARRRVDAARQELIARHPGRTVVAVAHVTPIKLLVGLALDAPLHALYRMELLPCSLTTLAWWADGNASMYGFAESAHLRGVGPEATTLGT